MALIRDDSASPMVLTTPTMLTDDAAAPKVLIDDSAAPVVLTDDAAAP